MIVSREMEAHDIDSRFVRSRNVKYSWNQYSPKIELSLASILYNDHYLYDV